jgi:hypothetical protein
MNKFRNCLSSRTTLARLGLGAVGLVLLVLIASLARVNFKTPLHTSDPANASLASGPNALDRANVEAAYGKLPLRFEVNQGQTAAGAARGSGVSFI